MNDYIDWACALLPEMNCGTIDAEQTTVALQEISVRFGIRSFAMISEYDCTRESIPVFLLRMNSSYDKLKKQLDNGLSLRFLATALLTPDLYETEHLDRLLVTGTNLLPLHFPLSAYQEWMNLALNHLLYKKKHSILFTSFELAIIMFPDEVVKRLLRISGSVFQFNYKSLIDPKVCQIISLLLEQKSIVLLGTALNSLDKAYFYEFEYYLQMAQKNLSPGAYRQLLANNRLFWDFEP